MQDDQKCPVEEEDVVVAVVPEVVGAFDVGDVSIPFGYDDLYEDGHPCFNVNVTFDEGVIFTFDILDACDNLTEVNDSSLVYGPATFAHVESPYYLWDDCDDKHLLLQRDIFGRLASRSGWAGRIDANIQLSVRKKQLSTPSGSCLLRHWRALREPVLHLGGQQR